MTVREQRPNFNFKLATNGIQFYAISLYTQSELTKVSLQMLLTLRMQQICVGGAMGRRAVAIV